LINFNKIARITRTYRHLGRYQEILSVLFRHGFGDLLHNLKLGPYIDFGLNLMHRENHFEDLSRPERLRQAFESLGPTFIKLGQLLGTRPDLIPEEYALELSKLHNQASKISFEKVEKQLRDELKTNPHEVFAEIDRTALAAASMAQVHRAKLKDGQNVVLKVQRPHVKQRISIDLEILHYIAKLLEEHLPESRVVQPVKLLEQIRQNLSRELDFEYEIKNLELFSSAFENEPKLIIPKVFREYSSSQLLVMTYVEGEQLDRVCGQKGELYNRTQLAKQGAKFFMEQVFHHGFYHADPHPGNMLFQAPNRICLLDFGQVGRIRRRDRERLADLASAAVQKNEHKVVKILLDLTYHVEKLDRERLETEIREILDHIMGQPLKNISAGLVMRDLINLLKRHHMGIKSPYMILLRTMVSIEYAGRKLDPEFNLGEHMKPFLKRLSMERFHPSRIMEQVMNLSEDSLDLLQDLPRSLQNVLEKLNHQELSVDFHHKGLQPLNKTLVRVANRLTFAIILSSLIIGSSLIVHAGLPPTWHGVPIVGLGGFCLAGVIAFFLLITILRRSQVEDDEIH
jgi:ubiquinone biosynthesis protein